MFELKAGTVIQIYAPFNVPNGANGKTENGMYFFDHAPWKAHTAKNTTLYDKEDVYDAVALHNGREMPMWIERNVRLGKTVLRNGKYYAMVNPRDLAYLD